MADVTQASLTGRAAARAGTWAQYAGAFVSVTLIAGVGIWGYKLLVRDVTGIPVVRAMEGPMREAPVNPGGEVALHTGLAVNAVAAIGQAAAPEDMLVLAPAQVELLPEDLEIPLPESAAVTPAPLTLADAGLQLAEPLVAGPLAAGPDMAEAPLFEDVSDTAAMADTQPGEPQPLSDEEVIALADMIAAQVSIYDPLVDGAETIALASLEVGDAAGGAILPASTPGVARSPRPPLRPVASIGAAVTTATPAAAAQVASPGAPATVSREPVAAGTSVVQLGAYDSAEIAAQEWDRLRGRFGAFMAGKERLIQQAESSGRSFYRLRATGFADLSDARRFCSALVAEDAGCVPVLVN